MATLSARSVSRASNTFGSAMVVPLNTMPPSSAPMPTTMKTRIWPGRATLAAAFVLLSAGAKPAERTARTNRSR